MRQSIGIADPRIVVDGGSSRRSVADSLPTDSMFAAAYGALRGLASSYLRRERADHTLQATALVHEAYLQLLRAPSFEWKNRNHFIGTAANAMRQILGNHARRNATVKRGGGRKPVSLEGAGDPPQESADAALVRLDQALTDFAEFDPRASRVVELRFFGGLTMKEAAEVLGVSEITVRRDWVAARSWLSRYLGESG